MKKLLLTILFLLNTSVCYSDEIIKDFKEDSITVLNDELKKKDLKISSLTERITTLESDPGVVAATQAEQETGTSNTVYVTPGRQKYNASASKAWCMFNGNTAGTNAPTAGYNVTSVTKNGTGDYTINLTTAFSSANFAAFATNNASGGFAYITVKTTTTIRINTVTSAGALLDIADVSVLAFGDQ